MNATEWKKHRHVTYEGRIVYDRPKHVFRISDWRRISRHVLPTDPLECANVFVDMFNFLWLDYFSTQKSFSDPVTFITSTNPQVLLKMLQRIAASMASISEDAVKHFAAILWQFVGGFMPKGD